jgi:hypothetical protein
MYAFAILARAFFDSSGLREDGDAVVVLDAQGIVVAAARKK